MNYNQGVQKMLHSDWQEGFRRSGKKPPNADVVAPEKLEIHHGYGTPSP